MSATLTVQKVSTAAHYYTKSPSDTCQHNWGNSGKAYEW